MIKKKQKGPVLLAVTMLCSLWLVGCRGEGQQTATPLALDSLVVTDTAHIQLRSGLSTQLEVRLSYLYPTNADSLRYYLDAQMFSPSLAGLAPDKLVQEYLDLVRADMHQEFDAQMSDTVSDAGDEIELADWEINLSNSLVYQCDAYASFRIRNYTYTGGAHGFAGEAFYSFDRLSGRPISESDLFVEGFRPALAELIVQQLMRDKGVQTSEELEAEGFFNISEIEPNNNFLLTEQGIRYCFNPYEIAPYSSGVIQVELPWASLAGIARSGSLIEKYNQ